MEWLKGEGESGKIGMEVEDWKQGWGEEKNGKWRLMGGENGNRLGCPIHSVCTRKYVQHNGVNHEVRLSWTS
jgi:hypothetical protein